MAFSIQESSLTAEILLSIVVGIVGVCACLAFIFFWKIWGVPEKEEMDDTYEEYYKDGLCDPVESTTSTISSTNTPLQTQAAGKVIDSEATWLKLKRLVSTQAIPGSKSAV